MGSLRSEYLTELAGTVGTQPLDVTQVASIAEGILQVTAEGQAGNLDAGSSSVSPSAIASAESGLQSTATQNEILSSALAEGVLNQLLYQYMTATGQQLRQQQSLTKHR